MLLAEVTSEELDALAQDAAHLELLRQLKPRSMLVVPLVARGRAIRVIVLAYSTSGRCYDADDQALAQDLAVRMALAAHDSFLSTISHDLRNPLSVIQIIAQTGLYQTRVQEMAALGAVQEGLADIDRAVRRMDAMVEQLLDVARLQTSRPLQLRRQAVDLVALARRAAAEQARLTRRHTITVEATTEPLIGRWDAARLERVVLNLIGNAVKYSSRGGAVAITVAQQGHWAVLTVRDEGLGIPSADLNRVFEPFHRAANVGSIAGTGIGLASAKQIVEQHAGTISAESEEGQGATITIRLPLQAEDGA